MERRLYGAGLRKTWGASVDEFAASPMRASCGVERANGEAMGRDEDVEDAFWSKGDRGPESVGIPVWLGAVMPPVIAAERAKEDEPLAFSAPASVAPSSMSSSVT